MRLRIDLVCISYAELSKLVGFFEHASHRAHINDSILHESVQNEFKKTTGADELGEHVHQFLQHTSCTLDVLHLEHVNLLDLLIFKQYFSCPILSCFQVPLKLLVLVKEQALIECNYTFQSLGTDLDLRDKVMIKETFPVDDKVEVSFAI